jgi:hypothetical protein
MYSDGSTKSCKRGRDSTSNQFGEVFDLKPTSNLLRSARSGFGAQEAALFVFGVFNILVPKLCLGMTLVLETPFPCA